VASEQGNVFTEFFDENRLFLDEPLAERIDQLSRGLYEAWVGLTTYRPDDWSNGKLRAHQAAWTLEEKVPPIRREIESRLREILGVSEVLAEQSDASD
jgi:hypothetical protein